MPHRPVHQPRRHRDQSGQRIPESYSETWSSGDEFNPGGGACGPGWISDASLSGPCNPEPCSYYGSSFAPNPEANPFCGGEPFGPPPPPPAPPVKVTSLHIVSDCWSSKPDPLTRAPTRETKFQAYNGDTLVSSDTIVITEDVSVEPYGTPATDIIGAPNSSNAGGTFEDQKGLHYWQSGPVTLYQSFSVSIDGGPAFNIPVLMGGVLNPYLTVTFTWDYRKSIRRWILRRQRLQRDCKWPRQGPTASLHMTDCSELASMFELVRFRKR